MAERLREDLIEKKQVVDIVVGPDEYRRLPEFIDEALAGEKGRRRYVVFVSADLTVGAIFVAAPLRSTR